VQYVFSVSTRAKKRGLDDPEKVNPGKMTLPAAIFYYLAVASIASALIAVTRRNPVHAMLWVLALFLHVAGIFLLLGAEFLAAVQVIVYAGAILIFYLFVVMLLELPEEEVRPRFGKYWPFAAAVALCVPISAWLARAGIAPPDPADPPPGAPPRGSLAAIGTALFGPFALPFEMASLLLLAAIIGTVVLARKRKAGRP
jgi:NADH-quinone oxidoreductase subunit J